MTSDSVQVTQEKGSGLRVCSARTLAGEPCRGPVLRGSDPPYCLTHHPDLGERRRLMRQRGGAVTTSRRRLLLAKVDFENPRSVVGFIEAVTSAVLLGQLPVNVGEATVRMAAEAARLRDVIETAERLDAIEALLATLTPEGSGHAV